MKPVAPNRRLDIITRQLTGASLESTPALLQLGGADRAQQTCPRALHDVLLHDNGQLRQSIYEFLKVREWGNAIRVRAGGFSIQLNNSSRQSLGKGGGVVSKAKRCWKVSINSMSNGASNGV